MKKIFKTIVLSVFFTAILNSCFLSNEDPSDLIKKPAITQGQDAIILAFSPEKDMEYVNIIREYSDTEDFKIVSGVANIGQIIPESKQKLPNSFIFSDNFTNSEKYYRYKLRFYSGHKYTNTETTVVKKGVNGKMGDSVGAELVKSTDPIALKYESCEIKGKVSYTLELVSDLEMPGDFTELYFVAKSGNYSKPFKLGSAVDVADTDANGAPVTKKVVKGGSIIDFHKTITDEFLDVKFEIIGLIGMATLSSGDEDEPSTTYTWTLVKPVKISAVEISSAGDGSSDDDKKNFEIPKLEKESNIFDYSSNVSGR